MKLVDRRLTRVARHGLMERFRLRRPAAEPVRAVGGQQISVDRLGLRGRRAMRESGVYLQRPVLHELRGQRSGLGEGNNLSPCITRTGTVIFLRSSVESVWEKANDAVVVLCPHPGLPAGRTRSCESRMEPRSPHRQWSSPPASRGGGSGSRRWRASSGPACSTAPPPPRLAPWPAWASVSSERVTPPGRPPCTWPDMPPQ